MLSRRYVASVSEGREQVSPRESAPFDLELTLFVFFFPSFPSLQAKALIANWTIEEKANVTTGVGWTNG